MGCNKLRKIVVLGSTGSIGRQTLDVIRHDPELAQVVGLSAGSNVELLLQQAREFGVKHVAVAQADAGSRLAEIAPDLCVFSGAEGVARLAEEVECDLVVAAIVGAAGIMPTLRAIEAHRDIALANKETLVAAGELVMRRVREKNVALLPVDSEHSAIFQCLEAGARQDVDKILLTASGGPFRLSSLEALAQVTPEAALKHPTWRMGGKITIDSATLMNKGLEVIEAMWLFGVELDQIQVVIHPQSVVHSMVQYVDGSVIGQLGVADMRIPIQYALTYPHRRPSPANFLDLFSVGVLEFFPPDLERFPSLQLAYDAAREGGTMPAVMNAANEVAVAGFLAGKLRFMDIPKVVEEVMARHSRDRVDDIAHVLAADQWARKKAEVLVKECSFA